MMPVVAETPERKRTRHRWLWVLLVPPLLVLAGFAWTCVHPEKITIAGDTYYIGGLAWYETVWPPEIYDGSSRGHHGEQTWGITLGRFH